MYVRLFVWGKSHLFCAIITKTREKITWFRDCTSIFGWSDISQILLNHQKSSLRSLTTFALGIEYVLTWFTILKIFQWTRTCNNSYACQPFRNFIKNIQIRITRSNWFISDISFKRQVTEFWLNQIRYVLVKKLFSKRSPSHGNR